MTAPHERLRVALEPGYDVWVGTGPDLLRDALAAVDAARASQVAIVTDDQVAAAGHATRVADVWRGLGVEVVLLEVPSGEGSKSPAVWADLHARLAVAGCDRDTWVCAVGGGVIGDLAGFVAATWLRGVTFVQVPTTLLAMVDASVGGKTGLDLPTGKNLVGAFWQPRVVVADVAALASLPNPVLREGAVELYKHALLVDAPWRSAFHAAGAPAGLPTGLDVEAWTRLVAAGVQVKIDVVRRDPQEHGVRAHLNLGHTLAHALESASGHALSHGTAVAYGLVFAALLGRARGWVDWVEDAIAVARWAARAPLPDPSFATLFGYMGRDKKRRAGRLRFVLLEERGSPRLADDVTVPELERAWAELRAHFPGGPR